MATYIKKLETFGDKLEVGIIRNTKINKVLKALIKLNTIPKDEEFHFRERSVKLLGTWNQLLGAEPAEVEKKEDKVEAPTSNGVHSEAEKKADEKIKEDVEEPKDKVMSTDDAVEKISGEVKADAETKEQAIDAVQKEDGQATSNTKPEDNKQEASEAKQSDETPKAD